MTQKLDSVSSDAQDSLFASLTAVILFYTYSQTDVADLHIICGPFPKQFDLW